MDFSLQTLPSLLLSVQFLKSCKKLKAMSKILDVFISTHLKQTQNKQTCLLRHTFLYGDGLLEDVLSFKNHFGLTNLNVMQCWIIWTFVASA